MKKLLMLFLLTAGIAISGTAYADHNQSGNMELITEGLTASADTLESEDHEYDEDGWVLKILDNGEAIITKYLDPVPAKFDIPKKIYYDGRFYTIVGIGNWVFADRTNLKSVTFPDTLRSFGYETFARCSSLESVVFPDSVTNFGYDAFAQCTSLKSVTLPRSAKNLGEGLFVGCSSLTSVTLPEKVKNLGDYTFCFCTSLKSVDIPDSVTALGDSVFKASGLTSVNIPDSVTTIGSGAFWGLHDLPSITIPDSVTTIDSFAFRNCKMLTSVTLPESLTSIGKEAFCGCIKLKSVFIPRHVRSIGDMAFLRCNDLRSVMIPPFVVEIGSQAFGYLDEGEKYPGFVIECYQDSAGEQYAKKEGIEYQYIQGPYPPLSSEELIHNGDIYKILASAYIKPEKPRKTIVIPNKIKINGITYRVTEIAASSFKNDTTLRRITIGKNITIIGKAAFQNAKNLKTVIINSTKIKSIGKNAFEGTNKKLVIRVPKKKYTAYKKMLKEAGFKGKVVKK